MTNFYHGDAVTIAPETTFVSPYAPLRESLSDDPERLQRAWDLTLESMRADAARPGNANAGIDTRHAIIDRYEIHRAAVEAEQALAAVPAYEQPSRIRQIAGHIGVALHIRRFG